MDDKEIKINKNNLAFRDGFTTLMVEAYAMPSNTYVPDDSHAFLVTLDRSMCWKNFGRCWFDEGDRVKVAEQKAYKEWLLEFCPPEDYFRCGIFFGVNGVCHTITNRELLIGEDNVNISLAPKNFVTVSIFGKYGFGLDVLKQLVKDSYNRAIQTVTISEDILNNVLARIDNTLEEESLAWQELITEYIGINIKDIINIHGDALDKLNDMINELLVNREAIYKEFLDKHTVRTTYEKNIYNMLVSNLTKYIEYLNMSLYIDNDTMNMAKDNMLKFFNKLFKVIDEQADEVNKTGKLDPELAKKDS